VWSGRSDRRFALGQHFVNEGLLRARFGEIDQELAGVIPRLMSLDSDEYTRLLLNLSRSRSVGEAESPLAQPATFFPECIRALVWQVAKLSELLVLP
jgi:hypothetical protein